MNIPWLFSSDINIMSSILNTCLDKFTSETTVIGLPDRYIAKGPATDRTTVVDSASSDSASKSSESAITTSGAFRLVLRGLTSLITVVNFSRDLPATAHFRSVGQFWTIYFAQSFPVN